MVTRSVRGAVPAALFAAMTLITASCSGPDPDGPDLFRVAVNGIPGGSLLAAWGPPDSAGSVFVAGGFVSVDPARLAGTGMSAGRLVEYATGRFTTRCHTDAVLWWTHGISQGAAASEVWASGESGTVLRYRSGRCEVLPLGITFDEGAPTLWGIWARAPDDVWFVGGSAEPTGPKGVLIHYDGVAFARVATLPEFARSENLYKITRAGDRYVIVGSNGTVLVGDGANFSAAEAGITTRDNRLFTVSCNGPLCLAVGGVASGLILSSTSGPTGLHVDETVGSGSGGLNGVWVRDPQTTFIVGANGFTMHMAQGGFAGFRSYVAPARTQATLHGVGGNAAVTIAVGGELDERTPMQRGVILVRGDESGSFSFDGQAYAAVGTLRRSLGGSGQF